MINLSSYCGLVDAKIIASYKDLPLMSKPCALCEKKFDTYDKLIRHVEACHHYVTCGTCNSGFKTIDRLRTHIAKKHDGKGFIIQNKFDVEKYLTSLRKEALENDAIKEVHEVKRPKHSEKSKTCAVCNQEFKTRAPNSKHTTSAVFKTYDKLIKHVETFHHHVTCGTCKSTFKTVDNLRTHIENKHDGKGFMMQNKFKVEDYLTTLRKEALENDGLKEVQDVKDSEVVKEDHSEMSETSTPKGQLISIGNFSVFKSPKKRT